MSPETFSDLDRDLCVFSRVRSDQALLSNVSVTRCDTVTHGSDHTHDVGSVSANQRPVLRLVTNQRPVR